MTWLKGQMGWILTSVTLLIAAGMAFGRIQEIGRSVELKADQASIVRELDLVHDQLNRIEQKIDTLQQK
jgi:hypothetical protein